MSHQRNLTCIRDNLERAAARASIKPTDYNLTQVVDLSKALLDYHKFMAGEIERHQMCWTAIELTMDMPEWGTRGT